MKKDCEAMQMVENLKILSVKGKIGRKYIKKKHVKAVFYTQGVLAVGLSDAAGKVCSRSPMSDHKMPILTRPSGLRAPALFPPALPYHVTKWRSQEESELWQSHTLISDTPAPLDMPCSISPASNLAVLVTSSHRITEYPEMKGTHKDHQVQLLAPHRTTQKSRPHV